MKLPAEMEITLYSGRVIIVNKQEMALWRRQLESKLATAFPSMFGVKPQEVIDFSRNLATLLESGLPILQALQILHRQTQKGRLKYVLERMMEDLEQGDTLSEACAKHPTVFATFYIRMIRVGEETGNLDGTLITVAENYEIEAESRTQAMLSMLEPAMTIVMGLGVGFIALSIFMPMYSSLGLVGG